MKHARAGGVVAALKCLRFPVTGWQSRVPIATERVARLQEMGSDVWHKSYSEGF